MLLLYLKLISYLSLTFSLLSFAFTLISNFSLNEFIFLIFLLISSLSFHLRKNRLLFSLSFILFLIPIILFPSLVNTIFNMIFIFYIFNLINNNMKEVSYGNFVDYFKKSLPIIFIIIFTSIFLRYYPEKFSNIERFVLPYIFIYLVTSVLLLRVLRYLEYNPLDKGLLIINLRYTVIIILLALILSFPSIRNVIFSSFSKIFQFLVNIFTIVFGILFIIVGYFLQKLVYYIILFLYSKNIIKSEHQVIESLSSRLENILRLFMGQKKLSWTFLDTFITIVFSSLIILLTIILIFGLLKRNNFISKNKETYKEEKEFIFPKKNIFQSIFLKIKREKDLNIVRIYYKRYLKESTKRGIEILPSFTSLDIYEKTKHIFNPEILTRMREIYIYVRYNIKIPSSDLVKEFLSLYKKLKEKKS
ncbi:MAG: hypothetical protein NZ841_04510 [Dictyoglomus sp.]|nr:hypothetical protein [Dictyoglomus sp.]MDW8188538.1 hypothetical protein [Dictyoglomus sp.]